MAFTIKDIKKNADEWWKLKTPENKNDFMALTFEEFSNLVDDMKKHMIIKAI